MLPDQITVRFLRPLPVWVDGGLSRWRVDYDCYDKNGGRIVFFASCPADGRCVDIAKGRTRWMRDAPYRGGLTARLAQPDGELLVRIFLRAVRLGLAERVDYGNG